MCTGGRIRHHFKHNLWRRNAHVVIVGYQAVGTLGRFIADGASTVRIHGRNHEVRADVLRIPGFSGHADRNELLKWMTALGRSPKRVFVTHGERESAHAFAELMREKLAFDVAVPAYKDEFELS